MNLLAILLTLFMQYVPSVPATAAGGGGGATVALVSSTTCGGNFTNSFTCAVNQNIPVGARLLCVPYSNTSMATLTPACSDTHSNTYTAQSASVENNVGWPSAFLDSVITTQINNGDLITVSIPGSGGSNGAGVLLFMLSSHTGSNGQDVAMGKGGTTSSTASATTAATLTATDFVVACGEVSNPQTFASFTTGYTMLVTNVTAVNSYGFVLSCGWKTQSSGSTASVTSTLSGSTGWSISDAPYQQ